jgi:hypothetical protein
VSLDSKIKNMLSQIFGLGLHKIAQVAYKNLPQKITGSGYFYWRTQQNFGLQIFHYSLAKFAHFTHYDKSTVYSKS